MRVMKDSGIAWIGEIPEEWKVSTIKREYHFQTGWTPDTTHEDYFLGGNIWVNISDLKSATTYDSEKHISNEAVQSSSMNISPKGSLMYAFKLSVGAVSFCGRDMYTNEAIATFLPGKNSLRFLYYMAPIFIIKNANENIYGAKLLNQRLIRNAKIIIPPIAEQERIADYLDRKCSQIDAIIARQQEVIEKLKAYKLSVITEAVTKGLNPHAPMKDSGVEWIGEIPEQWETASISRVATVVRGASPRPAGDPRYFNGQDVPWITVAEVTKDDGKYIFSTESYLTKEGAECSRLVEKGTLLLSNSGATLGVPKVTLITGCINDGSVAFLDLNIEQMYLLYVFKSRTLELRKQMQGYGQPNLNTTIVKNIVVPLPHPDEQKSISEYLDKRCKAIDDTIEMKEKVVERLSKYKKSLIYEVVTGKKEV